MKKYVSRVIVMREGERITDFKNFKKSEVAYRDTVELMGSTGTVEKTPQQGFSIDYVIPVSNAKLSWSDVIDETWSIQYREGGARMTYTGVDCISEGEAVTDGQGETVMTLTFAAEDRIDE